jgi:hypothetical protein
VKPPCNQISLHRPRSGGYPSSTSIPLTPQNSSSTTCATCVQPQRASTVSKTAFTTSIDFSPTAARFGEARQQSIRSQRKFVHFLGGRVDYSI